MTEMIDRLDEISGRFDAIVFDQWGVLHDGTTPYNGVPEAVGALAASGKTLAVLSNSGKRSAPNAKRIAEKGYPSSWFSQVMTSGEALWLDLADAGDELRLLPIVREHGDAEAWADGLGNVSLTQTPQDADGILLMGLPDAGADEHVARALAAALADKIPIYCSNPDRASPRAGGLTVVSPGELAHRQKDAGGMVHFYGKPHRPIFDRLQTELGVAPNRILMVGDSLEHDIAGARAAGWSSLFVEGGLHASHFPAGKSRSDCLADLAAAEAAPEPDFSIPIVN
ncbi:MAG: TIGR01459 family HAD-type hydrolase [Pseudomonadota bacterium]